ncbi:MAG: N-acetylmuramoyl-L-alanine amidase [Clostridium sp.]|nr:N-acetylmuramoyl-L-alanine amidase [Clostridium sp.]
MTVSKPAGRLPRCHIYRRLIPAVVCILLMTVLPGYALGKENGKTFTVVIDAGHGGKDHGAIGKLSREKNINLGVAMKLGKMIEEGMEDVRVVYTRNSDKFVSLQGRADIANEAGGDLFISIHTNSVSEESKTRMSASGTSVYVLGHKSESNLAVAKRENSVIMLEDDYTTTYHGFDPNSTESYIAFELIQNQHMEHSLQAAQQIQTELVSSAGRKDNGVRQAMFWVLVKTGMPAVLVELDFICNPVHDRYLGSEAGQTQLAEAIYNGFRSYKLGVDKERMNTTATPDARPAAPKPVEKKKKKEEQKETSPAPATVYKIQFLTAPGRLQNGDPKLKGLKNTDSYRDGGSWKYTVGEWISIDDAKKELKKIRKKFPDAFVVTFRDGQRVK